MPLSRKAWPARGRYAFGKKAFLMKAGMGVCPQWVFVHNGCDHGIFRISGYRGLGRESEVSLHVQSCHFPFWKPHHSNDTVSKQSFRQTHVVVRGPAGAGSSVVKAHPPPVSKWVWNAPPLRQVSRCQSKGVDTTILAQQKHCLLYT